MFRRCCYLSYHRSQRQTHREEMKIILAEALLLLIIAMRLGASQDAANFLQMYVDELPQMPKIYGYSFDHDSSHPHPVRLSIGMFEKKWKFHRELPETRVFAYGNSEDAATFPGPTIEARQGVPPEVTWENHLPHRHFLPVDPTITGAGAGAVDGVPTVVHLHGGVQGPESDGSPLAWFTSGLRDRGPAWSTATYRYPNAQQPGSHWYHDHAVGLTRLNQLAGLLGAYVVRDPPVEGPLRLPSDNEFDRFLVVADRSFSRDGSIYMNATGVDPAVHPSWRPVYYGDAIVVNGKACVRTVSYSIN